VGSGVVDRASLRRGQQSSVMTRPPACSNTLRSLCQFSVLLTWPAPPCLVSMLQDPNGFTSLFLTRNTDPFFAVTDQPPLVSPLSPLPLPPVASRELKRVVSYIPPSPFFTYLRRNQGLSSFFPPSIRTTLHDDKKKVRPFDPSALQTTFPQC